MLSEATLNPFSRKLQSFLDLGPGDAQALDELGLRVQRIGAHEDIVQEGDEPDAVTVILEGWACRYKQLEDGRRQIISFFLPGDMCDPFVFLFRSMDHSLGTLTPVTLIRLSEETIRNLMARSKQMNEAFWYDMLVSADIQREWTVSLGRRTATERLAHLFCEIVRRLQVVGLTDGRECDMPITQTDLGDAMGLSSVHVNRTLQELRSLGFLSLKGRRLTIHNGEALRRLAMFDPSYLHTADRRAERREVV